jgi:hypothetical protein
MGGREITFITDSVLAWYYMIFDKEIIVLQPRPIVEEAWDKVVDTIKAKST